MVRTEVVNEEDDDVDFWGMSAQDAPGRQVVDPEKPMNPIILAVDVPDQASAFKLIEKVGTHVGTYKIGSELFTACGPEIIRRIRSMGASVFLDLKFYDIPNTVAKAVAAAVALDVQMLTIHTSGGRSMMEAAVKASQSAARNMPPLLLGVTVLTSFSESLLAETGVSDAIENQVLRLGRLAVDCGLAGLVCSPLELGMLRQSLPSQIQLVTPGIRLPDSQSDDQARIMTPGAAMKQGANFLVIGRPIYAAADPAAAARAIFQSLS